MRKVENDVAREFCTPTNLPVAKEIAETLLKKAMKEENTKRTRELSSLVDSIDAALAESSRPAPPPSMAASTAVPQSDSRAKK